MRQAALGKIASEVRTAVAQEQGDDSAEAVDQIAAQMQQFLASDVVYDARVLPLIQEELADKEIGGQETQDSQFLPSLEWLDSGFVADQLGAEGGGNTRTDGEPAPGLHGHGLESVSVGDVTLQPGETANRIPAGSNVVFNVTFANQGDNDESDVNVAVRIDGDGERISARKRVDQTKAGTNSEVAIPLTEAPPIGTPVTIEVEVGKVPGEEKTDNNSQTYTAIFTR
jgi:peptidoglycan hydrolase-like protein with peptidoglycan-binding domain